MPEYDCELSMTTNEVDYLLETGEMPSDLETALETMLQLAIKRMTTVCCKFTVAFEPATKDEPSEDN